MAVTWDYDAIKSQIDRGVGGDRTLSSSTLVVCLSALSGMERRGTWDALTDTEFDNVENWVSGAYRELLTAITCSGESEVKKAIVSYETTEDVAGVSITANVLKVVPLNTEEDPYSLVSLVGSNKIVLAEGYYHVHGVCSLYPAGRGKVWIIDESDNKIVQGVNRDNSDQHIHFQGFLTSNGTNGFYLVVLANASGDLGREWDQDVNEVYAQLTFTLMAEV